MLTKHSTLTLGKQIFFDIREDCIAVRNLFCFNDWAWIEDNKNKNIFLKSRGHFRLPICEDLPSYKTAVELPCSHTRLTIMKPDQVTRKYHRFAFSKRASRSFVHFR